MYIYLDECPPLEQLEEQSSQDQMIRLGPKMFIFHINKYLSRCISHVYNLYV